MAAAVSIPRRTELRVTEGTKESRVTETQSTVRPVDMRIISC